MITIGNRPKYRVHILIYLCKQQVEEKHGVLIVSVSERFVSDIEVSEFLHSHIIQKTLPKNVSENEEQRTLTLKLNPCSLR